MKIAAYIHTCKKYRYLLHQLVSRDFKVKYKRSLLGVLWSVLYPLFMMFIMTTVFQNLFKMSGGDVNYPVYILTGLVIFNFYTEATNLAMSSIVGNFNLITKVYIPKYVFPISKTLTACVNMFFSLIALYSVIIMTGQPITWHHFLLLYDFICLLMFTIGMSLIVSALTVFFRDMYHLYGLIVLAWTYMTPIFYDISIINVKLLTIFRANPMYQFISFARRIILYETVPTIQQFILIFCFGFSSLFIGFLFFKKLQKKFIYYI